MNTLHLLLNLATIISVVLLYTTSHPIYSVLLLVLLFCEASMTLFLFNIEFLSLLLIVVYVGAIAVLFLFVVMMLNIKTVQQNLLKKTLMFIGIVAFLISFIYIFLKDFMVNFNFFSLSENNATIFKIDYYDAINNLELLGQFLLNEYSICLIIVGLLLLVPLLGSIALTLDCTSLHSSNVVNRQLSRSSNVIAFFK